MSAREKRKEADISYAEIFEHIVYWILIALVSLLPIVIFPWEDDLYSLPKVTLLRLLFLFAAASWSVLVFWQRKIRLRRSALDMPLLAFVMFLVVSTLFSFNRVTSVFADAYGRNENFFTWLIYVALFVIVTQALKNKKNVRRILETMVIASGPVSLYAIFQQLGFDFLDLEVKGFAKYQAVSTFGNAAYLGGYLCLIFPVSLALTVSEVRPGKKILWILLSFLATLSLVFTFSRGAWLGFLVGVLVFLVLLAKRALRNVGVRRQLKYTLIAFALLVILSVAVSQLLPTTSGLVTRRLRALVTLEKAGSGRLYIWKNAIDLVSKRPLLGWGLNTFKDVLPYDRPELELAKLIDRPHNQILSIAFSGGALLLLAYFWVIFTYLLYSRGALNRIREQEDFLVFAGLVAAVAAYLVHEQFFFSLVEVTPLFWVMLGLGVVMGDRMQEKEWELRFSMSAFGQWLGITLVVLLALVLGFISAGFVAANYFHSRGLLLENRDRFDEAASLHKRAIELNPWENRYKFSYGQALENHSMVTQNPALLREAIAVYLLGIKQNPKDYDLHFALGKTYYTISFLERSGDYSKAKLALRKAAELRPLVSEPYMWLGLAFLQEGDFSQGVKYLERARRIGGTEYGDVPVLFALAQGYYKLGRVNEAKKLLKEVLKLDPNYSDAKELLEQLERGKPKM